MPVERSAILWTPQFKDGEEVEGYQTTDPEIVRLCADYLASRKYLIELSERWGGDFPQKRIWAPANSLIVLGIWLERKAAQCCFVRLFLFRYFFNPYFFEES